MSSSPPTGLLSAAEALALVPEAFAAAGRAVRTSERRAAWMEQKRGKFGASSSWCFWTPSKMEEAKNVTVRKLIERKAAELDGADTPEVGAAALRWGNDEEAPGMEEFAEKSGLTVTAYGEEQQWREWSGSDQIGATKDGIVTAAVDPEYLLSLHTPEYVEAYNPLQWLRGGQPVEIPVEQKNPHTPAEHSRMVGLIETGADLRRVEFKYWVQVQQQIMVLDAPFGIFFTRDSRRRSASRLAWWVVPRDEKFIQRHADRLLRAVNERDLIYERGKTHANTYLRDFIYQ